VTADYSYEPRSTIFIRNLMVHGSIGALSHERHGPQPIRISVEMEVPTIIDHGDQLDKVVPYHPIVGRIHAILAEGHVELVETLAQRIIAAAFDEPRLLSVTVTVEKPDVIPDAEAAGIRLTAHRQSRP
jgi:7,8-dihydroneopterin aldolase/epimerase/oxygenase